MANPENLKPFDSVSVAREMGRKGGKKAGESKRKKKLLSQIYGELLAENYEIDIDGVKSKITGEDLVKFVSRKIILKGDSSSVSMLKEIRESTEGSKIAMTVNPDDPTIMTPGQRKKRIAELMQEKPN